MHTIKTGMQVVKTRTKMVKTGIKTAKTGVRGKYAKNFSKKFIFFALYP